VDFHCFYLLNMVLFYVYTRFGFLKWSNHYYNFFFFFLTETLFSGKLEYKILRYESVKELNITLTSLEENTVSHCVTYSSCSLIIKVWILIPSSSKLMRSERTRIFSKRAQLHIQQQTQWLYHIQHFLRQTNYLLFVAH